MLKKNYIKKSHSLLSLSVLIVSQFLLMKKLKTSSYVRIIYRSRILRINLAIYEGPLKIVLDIGGHSIQKGV